MPASRIGETFGIAPTRLQASLDELVAAETLITGQLIAGCEAELVCDSQNFESFQVEFGEGGGYIVSADLSR